MIRRPPRSTQGRSSAASDVYKRQVVATATETMEAFANCTYLCKDSDEYVLAIEKALEEDNAQKQQLRKEVAASHSWENSINLFYNAVASQKN